MDNNNYIFTIFQYLQQSTSKNMGKFILNYKVKWYNHNLNYIAVIKFTLCQIIKNKIKNHSKKLEIQRMKKNICTFFFFKNTIFDKLQYI